MSPPIGKHYIQAWEDMGNMLAILDQANRLKSINDAHLQGNHAGAKLKLSDGSVGCLDIKLTLRIPEGEGSHVLCHLHLDE